MNEHHLIATMIAMLMATSSPVQAERAWEGHLRLIDSNITMVFDGYDYGTWDDVGRLEFPARGRPRDGAWSVRFRITPDKANVLQSTIPGTIELVVDQQKAVLNELKFVREHKHANWKIDPEIIQQLKESPKQSSKIDEPKNPEADPHGKSTNRNKASSYEAGELLLDGDFTRSTITEEKL